MRPSTKGGNSGLVPLDSRLVTYSILESPLSLGVSTTLGAKSHKHSPKWILPIFDEHSVETETVRW